MKQFILLCFSIAACFCSCDPVGNAHFYVKNDATGKIYLCINDTLVQDSVVSGEKKMVYCDCGVGGGRIPSNVFYKGTASINLRTVRNDTAACSKDIIQEANWELIRLDDKQHEYVFTVRNSDF